MTAGRRPVPGRIPALLAVLCLLAAAACRPAAAEPGIFRQTRVLMGTLVEITLVARGETEAEGHFRAAFGEMERLDNLLGSHEQRGEIWSLNTRGYPGGVRVTPEVFDLLLRAREKGRETGGAFDVTVGGLMRLWSFDTGGRVPQPQEIAGAEKAVGWDKVILDDRTKTVTFAAPGVLLDLGGIGKGYAVDMVFDLLRRRGLDAGIINAGGDLVVWGGKPDGAAWRVGIQHPQKPDRLLGVLTLPGRAIVTSGDYEKNFTVGGRLYHHILDPATGYPAAGITSATVVADRAEDADAYATALIVMGPEKARRFLAQHPALEGIIVDNGGEVFITAGLKDAFSRQD